MFSVKVLTVSGIVFLLQMTCAQHSQESPEEMEEMHSVLWKKYSPFYGRNALRLMEEMHSILWKKCTPSMEEAVLPVSAQYNIEIYICCEGKNVTVCADAAGSLLKDAASGQKISNRIDGRWKKKYYCII